MEVSHVTVFLSTGITQVAPAGWSCGKDLHKLHKSEGIIGTAVLI